MLTTAEGVETQDQLSFLRSEGCNQVQGYHLGRPQPADKLGQLLEKDASVQPMRVERERARA